MVLDALLRPDAFFAERAPGLSLARAALVVALVALVTTAVVGAFGWSLSQQLTQTTEIPNDERPPDWVCDDETTSEVDEMMQDGCDQPKQKTVVVGDLFWDRFSGMLPLVLFSGLLAWPLYGVGLHVLSAIVNGEGSFADTLAVAAWGMLPSAFQAVVGFGLLLTTLGSVDLSASNPELLASQVETLSQRAQGDTAVLALAAAAWQGYVWTFGLKHARKLPTGSAAFAGGTIALVTFLFGIA
ncbi:Yip1 family protein [Halorussus litoreus]|uniref:Yip1 family protein n=1 Tax=Halorussus litoreus TaxID=1710536 RepID=UPI000E25D477|nr:Yip1 family protein [Halorussus litoreus]